MEQVTEFIPELAETTFKSNITPVERYHLLLERFAVVAEVLRATLLFVFGTSFGLRLLPGNLVFFGCVI